MPIVAANVSEDLHRALKALAKKRLTSMSTVIRQELQRAVEEEKVHASSKSPK